MSQADRILIAIDIGAGLARKVGLFCDPHHQISGTVLPRERFGENFDQFVGNLLETLELLLKTNGGRMSEVRAIGIASPGLFCSDGRYLLAANVPMLTGHNLRERLARDGCARGDRE